MALLEKSGGGCNPEQRVEALLMTSTKPLSASKLAKYLNSNTEGLSSSEDENNFNESGVLKLISILNEFYEKESRSFRIVKFNGEFFISIKSHLQDFLKSIGEKSRPETLSDGVLEVLSVVAYKQPVSKSLIERIRGVSSESALRILLSKGLIRTQHSNSNSVSTYTTTPQFLKVLELESMQGLPHYSDFIRT